MRFPRHEYWSGLPFPALEDLLDSGIKPLGKLLLLQICARDPVKGSMHGMESRVWGRRIMLAGLRGC